MSAAASDRMPYAGAGEDGCRRSAQIDRDEAEGLSWGSERREELEASAERWDDQGYRLLLERLGPRPSISQLRVSVGSEEWLAAIAMLELCPDMARSAAQFTEWARRDGNYTYEGEGDDRVSTFHPSALMDWEAWERHNSENEVYGSSTEARLYDLVLGLTIPGRTVQLVGSLDRLGSWERDVLDILVQWASGGNNRELPGRYSVTENPS